jgi:hypothetical protein
VIEGAMCTHATGLPRRSICNTYDELMKDRHKLVGEINYAIWRISVCGKDKFNKNETLSG